MRTTKSIFFVALVSLLVFFTSCQKEELLEQDPVSEDVEELGAVEAKSAQSVIRKMHPGINLGNTYDAIGPNENFWGNKTPSQRVFNDFKKAGFKSVRIPVTWNQKTRSSGGKFVIDNSWLSKVERAVNMALKAKLYVIIDIHHDEDDWLNIVKGNEGALQKRLNDLWGQIASRFKNKSNRLIFEIMNEPRDHTLSNPFDLSMYGGQIPALNDKSFRLAKGAIDVIRKTGGKNKKRLVMVQPVAASGLAVTSDGRFNLARFGFDPKLTILSVHLYAPFPFSSRFIPNDNSWTGTSAQKSRLTGELNKIKSKAGKYGVIVGEWGTDAKRQPSGKWNRADRARHAKFFSTEMKKRGFAGLWWDVGAAHDTFSGALYGRDFKGTLNPGSPGACNVPGGPQGWLKRSADIVRAITGKKVKRSSGKLDPPNSRCGQKASDL